MTTATKQWHEIVSTVPRCRCFQRECGDGFLTAFVGREPAGKNGEMIWHLSMSHHKHLCGADGNMMPGRIPTWGELKNARYEFCPDEIYMAIILPPKAEYVNLHETTMHLWEVEQ